MPNVRPRLRPSPNPPQLTRRRSKRTEKNPKVGDIVDIWWDVDKTYYRGSLTRYHDHPNHFRVVYFDGEMEDLNLENEYWKFATDDHPSSHLPPDNTAQSHDQVIDGSHNSSEPSKTPSKSAQKSQTLPSSAPPPSSHPSPTQTVPSASEPLPHLKKNSPKLTTLNSSEQQPNPSATQSNPAHKLHSQNLTNSPKKSISLSKSIFQPAKLKKARKDSEKPRTKPKKTKKQPPPDKSLRRLPAKKLSPANTETQQQEQTNNPTSPKVFESLPHTVDQVQPTANICNPHPSEQLTSEPSLPPVTTCSPTQNNYTTPLILPPKKDPSKSTDSITRPSRTVVKMPRSKSSKAKALMKYRMENMDSNSQQLSESYPNISKQFPADSSKQHVSPQEGALAHTLPSGETASVQVLEDSELQTTINKQPDSNASPMVNETVTAFLNSEVPKPSTDGLKSASFHEKRKKKKKRNSNAKNDTSIATSRHSSTVSPQISSDVNQLTLDDSDTPILEPLSPMKKASHRKAEMTSIPLRLNIKTPVLRQDQRNADMSYAPHDCEKEHFSDAAQDEIMSGTVSRGARGTNSAAALQKNSTPVRKRSVYQTASSSDDDYAGNAHRLQRGKRPGQQGMKHGRKRSRAIQERFEAEPNDISKPTISKCGKDHDMSDVHDRQMNAGTPSPVTHIPERGATLTTMVNRRLDPMEKHLRTMSDDVQRLGQMMAEQNKENSALKEYLESMLSGILQDFRGIKASLNDARLETQSLRSEMLNAISSMANSKKENGQGPLQQRDSTERENLHREIVYNQRSNSASARMNGFRPQIHEGNFNSTNENLNPVRDGGMAPNPCQISERPVRHIKQSVRNVEQNRVGHTSQHVAGERQEHPDHRERFTAEIGNPSQFIEGQSDGYQVRGSQGLRTENNVEVGPAFHDRVINLVARQITVWLLETPHEYQYRGLDLSDWAKHTSAGAFERVAERLSQFDNYLQAHSTLSISLGNDAVELAWFIRPQDNGNIVRARRNYAAWDPPPTDDEWNSEVVLLKELANGFHHAMQMHERSDVTDLRAAVTITKYAASMYGDLGYRPLNQSTASGNAEQRGQAPPLPHNFESASLAMPNGSQPVAPGQIEYQ